MPVDSSPEGGGTATPPRERLLRFARMMGAGAGSESAVQEALRAAAEPDDADPQRAWPLLANILAERAADRYRQVARAQILVRHRALVPFPPPLRPGPAGPTDPSWAARRLVALLPREVLDLLWNHHIGGLSWDELATTRRVPPDILRRQVHHALHTARRRIALAV